MSTAPILSPTGLRSTRAGTTLTEFLTLGLLAFAGNFLFARLFGVYDDDFAFTVPAFSWSWADAWGQIRYALLHWPQGRPVGFALTHLLSYLSAQTSSLSLGYAIGYLIVLFNSLLLHRLARRFLPAPAALLAAGVLTLYPIDTSKAILMHRVFMQLNLALLLLALLCYVHGRRRLSYLVAALCFLTYEPIYLIFLAAPLLVPSYREFSWRRTILHAAICSGTIVLLLIGRQHIGDPRIGETFGESTVVISRIVQALWIGPATAITALVVRPFEALHATDPWLWIPVLLCAAAFYAAVRSDAHTEPITSDAPRGDPRWITGAGLLSLILGYLVCFRLDYWPPIMTIGRLSGYHAAGSVGAALFVGGLWAWALEKFPRLQRVLGAAAALYCGLLVSFGIEVQRIDFVKHAEQQSRFWSIIIDTSGEWEPDTVILVDISGQDPSRPCTPGMPLWWTVNFAPTLLDRLINWPDDWPRPSTGIRPVPRVYGYIDSFETFADGDALVMKTPAWLGAEFWPHIRDDRFIYFRFYNGRMARVNEPVTIAGRSMRPKSQPALRPPALPTTRFSHLLFEDDIQWQCIRHARNYPR